MLRMMTMHAYWWQVFHLTSADDYKLLWVSSKNKSALGNRRPVKHEKSFYMALTHGELLCTNVYRLVFCFSAAA